MFCFSGCRFMEILKIIENMMGWIEKLIKLINLIEYFNFIACSCVGG